MRRISPRRFGIAISPLKISERAKTESRVKIAPKAEKAAKSSVKIIIFFPLKRHLKAVSPQKYQPITVQKAKTAIKTVRKKEENFPITV